MVEMVKIGSADTLPAAAPYRNGRQKYPWNSLQPGEWFKFADSIRPTSARVLASNSGNAWGRRFHVFAGEDGGLYCRRVDGLQANDRFLKVQRDEFGNPVTPMAKIHPQSEPTPKPIDRGRIYGEGIPQEPMPGETIYYGGAGTVSSPLVDDDVPFDGGGDAAGRTEEDEI